MRRRAVVTYYQKKYAGFVGLVLERLKDYATRCRADLLEYHLDETCDNQVIEKFFHIATLPKYQRYLIIDVDVLIRRDAPDIFGVVPPDKLGMYNEAAYFHTPVGTIGEAVMIRCNDMATLVNRCQIPYVDIPTFYTWHNPFRYFNSGVIVHNRESITLHQGFSRESIRLLKQHARRCGEQTLINYCILAKKYVSRIYHLPVCFDQMPHNRCADYLETTWFSHYAGLDLDAKEVEMRRDHDKWQSVGL